ncbi:MAG TPA: Holliday junction resolvase RuvX [Alcanivoracaceae bacterium]|nr:Holliday junction resolvase RuvX [Alcanivoracaceae bacterium]
MHKAPFTVLSFDFGANKIGVAVGQSLTGTASPLAALSAKDGQPNWQQVQQLIEEWEPQYLIVGLPLNMDGSTSESSRRARRFAGRLQGRFGVPVRLIDERLSTREARARLGDNYRGGADPKVDSIAASLFIESFFNDDPGAPL